MSLFSRLAKIALALFIAFALTSISGTWSTHGAGSWLSATPAWAGSPDETLNPPPTPKSRYAPGITQYDPAAASASMQVARTGAGFRWTERLAFVWRFYLASVLRI